MYGEFHPRRPEFRIIESSSACKRSTRLSVLVVRLKCNFSGKYRILYAPHEVSFDRLDQDSVAEIQFRLRLIVFLLIMRANVFVIPKVINLMDSQGAEIAKERFSWFSLNQNHRRADPVL